MLTGLNKSSYYTLEEHSKYPIGIGIGDSYGCRVNVNVGNREFRPNTRQMEGWF